MDQRSDSDNPFAAPSEVGGGEPTEAEGEWLRAKIWMFAGLAALMIGGSLLEQRKDWPALAGGFIGSAAYGCLCMGAAYWAKSKGHSAWLGLLGMLGIVAPLVLFMLPERPRKRLIADIDEQNIAAEHPYADVEKQIEASIGDWITVAGNHGCMGGLDADE